MNSKPPKNTLTVIETSNGLTLSIRAIPRAKRNEVVSVIDGVLKVCLTAPPEDGRANKALIGLLAKYMNIKRNQISIITGSKSRKKTIQITGMFANELFARLDFSRRE